MSHFCQSGVTQYVINTNIQKLVIQSESKSHLQVNMKKSDILKIASIEIHINSYMENNSTT